MKRQGIAWTKNTHALAQALYERQVPVVWNDLIREVERSAKGRTSRPCHPAGTGTWVLLLSTVLSNWLKPLHKPSGSESIKCRTQDLVV